jgi:hypothetical protein
LAAWLALPVVQDAAYGRTWTDASGQQTVEARFVTVQFDKIWLLRNDGRVFGIEWADLCDADQDYVRRLIRERKSRPAPLTRNRPGRVPYDRGRELCRLANRAIDESSGLACSRLQPGFFWTHNDSGGDARAYLFDRSGRDLGWCQLDGILAFDLEDTLSLRSDGKSYVVLCDVGNNGRAAGVQMLHVFQEPEFDGDTGGLSERIAAPQTIHYAYEDDHQDCEAVGIDPTSKTFLFVTKEKGPKCSVYALPWPDKILDEAYVARRIGTLQLETVTAMDVSPDGRRAIVLTYGDAFEFQRDGSESWTQAFARPPRRIVMPERVQGESICYGWDGETLYLTSENLPTPLWMVPVLQHDRPASASGPGARGDATDASYPCSLAQDDLTIDCDFPGGNILVERAENDVVYLRQDLRDTSTWWFYWCFRVRGAGDRRLTFHFTDKNVFAAHGPAVSTDEGSSWRWLGADAVQGDTFAYTFSGDEPEVRFCFTMPYVERDLQRFIAAHKGDPHLSVRQLCATRRGRVAERLHVGVLDGDPAHRVLLTARHHACESMASYVLEGLLAAALDNTEDGRWYRENVEILAIPFVDKDGVEDGDQGKNRKPYDHNRDYKGASIYPTVAAIRSLVPAWSQGRLHAAIDLHCPWIRGPRNEVIYMVGRSEPEAWQQQMALGQIIQQLQQGRLVYRAADNLPFGQAWNTAENYGDRMSFSMWAVQQKGIRVATSFEIPYANAAGRRVDADSARSFGRDLARAVRSYLTQ